MVLPSPSVAVVAEQLIDLILRTQPSPARLLSYYAAALDHALIHPDQAASHIVKALARGNSSTRLQEPTGGFCRTLASLCGHLLGHHPNLIIEHPGQSIDQLTTLLQLIRAYPSSEAILTLAEQLIVGLTRYMLSHPTAILLDSRPPNPQAPSRAQCVLDSLLRACHPSPGCRPSAVYSRHLPQLLHHLSPATARQLALNPPSGCDPPSHPPTALLVYILLTPGAAARPSNGHALPPLLSRVVAFALSLGHPPDFVFQLLLAAIRLPEHPSTAHRSSSFLHRQREENPTLVWKALLAGGRLAELIRAALDSPPLAHQRQQALLNIAQLERLAEELILQPQPQTLPPPSPAGTSQYTHRHHLWFALLSSLCSNQLILPQDILVIQSPSPSHPLLLLGHHSQIHLGLLPLIDCLGLDSKMVTTSEIATKLIDAITTASKNFDLSTCISITKSIGTKESLTTMFLWIEPSAILIPITNILDHWTDFRNQNDIGNNDADEAVEPNNLTNRNNGNEDDEASSASEFEKFASLLGWIQGVVGWFGLKKNLRYHLGRTTGFTVSCLANPSTTYAIDSLPAKQKNTLESWLEALYGSSGISDDLLIKTDPRIFFKICATSLFKQSFDALKVGLIDLQLFRDGLSYFEQEILVVGSAVGVVGWLLDELDRVGSVSPTSYPAALLEILQAILLSNAITPTSIDLISARSLRLLRRFNSMFLASPSITTSEEIHDDLNRRVQLDLDKIEKKLTTVPVSGFIAPTDFLCFNISDSNQLPDSVDKSNSELTWQAAFKTAIKRAIVLEKEEGSERATTGLWSLLPHVLEAIPVDQFVKITIDGTVDAIRSSDQNQPSDVSTIDRIGGRLERKWDVSKHFLLERAVQVAADILTWPFDSHHDHQFQLPKVFAQYMAVSTSEEEKEAEEKEDLVEMYASKFKLAGPVLLELFTNWGQRVRNYQDENRVDLDAALIERDIVIQCLNRTQIHERVCFNLSPTSLVERNQNEIEGTIEHEPKNDKQKSESIVTDFFRRVCFKSLILEKIHHFRLGNKKKRRMGDEIEARKIKSLKFSLKEEEGHDDKQDENVGGDETKDDSLKKEEVAQGLETEIRSAEDQGPKDKENDKEQLDDQTKDHTDRQEPIVLDDRANVTEKVVTNQNRPPLQLSLTKKHFKTGGSPPLFHPFDWVLLGLQLQLVDNSQMDHIPSSLLIDHQLDLDVHLHLLENLDLLVLGLVPF